jgi:hypothetical protein
MECSHNDQLIQKGEHVNGTSLKRCFKSLLGQRKMNNEKSCIMKVG